MIEPGAVVEHRESATVRWLRERRVSLAIGVAILEGILIVAGELSKALALIVAIAIVVGYFVLSDRLKPGVGREIAWIAAVSQAIVMLVPLLVFVIGTLALIGLAVIGLVALALLFSRRG
jgi:VIT1/CCC1 family predicted Fe2+/Mn2+ transporter